MLGAAYSPLHIRPHFQMFSGCGGPQWAIPPSGMDIRGRGVGRSNEFRPAIQASLIVPQLLKRTLTITLDTDWLWLIEGRLPERLDLAGAGLAMVGTAIILALPRRSPRFPGSLAGLLFPNDHAIEVTVRTRGAPIREVHAGPLGTRSIWNASQFARAPRKFMRIRWNLRCKQRNTRQDSKSECPRHLVVLLFNGVSRPFEGVTPPKLTTPV